MSNYLPEQLQTAYETYQQNPNAARQLVSATAQGRQPPSLQGLAAAAALQAPQKPVAPPQGTVLQHLAAQQGIGGQIPNVLGMAPQGAPAPQDPALAPQMPTQAMAGGGLVSFMHGGDVRGFATGTSELLRAQGIPDSPGYFESGDINDIKKAFEVEQDLRTALAEKQLKQAVQGASGYSTEMPEALVSQTKTPNAYQLRGKGYIPEAPSFLSGLTPEQLDAEKARLNKAIKWQNLAQHSAVPEVPPELSMMEKLAGSSAAPAAKVDPRMAQLTESAKVSPVSDIWTGAAEPTEVLAGRAADAAKLSKITGVAGKVGKVASKAAGPIGIASLAMDPRLQAIMELSKMPVRAMRGDKNPDARLAPSAHIAYELPKAMETVDYLKGLVSGKAEGGEIRGYSAGDLIESLKNSSVTPSIPEMLGALTKSKEAPVAEAPSYGMASLDSFSPDVKFDYGLGAKTGVTPHIEKAAVHPEAKKTDPAFKKAAIDTSSTAAQPEVSQETQKADAPAPVPVPVPAQTPEDTISYLQELAGGPRKLSPEMMQKLEENVTGAKEDKWLGALMGLVGGTLSSSSPYFGQAVGEGGLKGLSAYQQGAKEQGGAEQALLSAQLGQEDAGRAAQQAAFEHYMKQEQAKMAAQTDLAKAKLGWGAKDYLTQLTEAGKDRRALEMGGYRSDLQLPQLQMQLLKEANDAVDNARKTKAATGQGDLTPEEERIARAKIYSQFPQIPMPNFGLGGAGYSGYSSNISRIVQ